MFLLAKPTSPFISSQAIYARRHSAKDGKKEKNQNTRSDKNSESEKSVHNKWLLLLFCGSAFAWYINFLTSNNKMITGRLKEKHSTGCYALQLWILHKFLFTFIHWVNIAFKECKEIAPTRPNTRYAHKFNSNQPHHRQ